MISGTNTGSELLLELDRTARRPLRAQLEDELREAVRSGRLRAQARLPASRVLAFDLGVSRRLVVDAYAQLLAEGYLVARPGAGTYVADAAAAASAPTVESPARTLAFDFFPGYPDLASFPRRAWLRAMRETLMSTPHGSLGYPDPRGALELRRALAGHLRRVRGVVADPQAIVICSGAAQGLALLARALGKPHVAMEDPGLPQHHAILAAHGARLSALAVDARGARVEELDTLAAQHGALDAVFVTPAHQSPTGVALAPERRAALLDWARDSGGLVIEDDYDAEYRYDRAPLAALQGLAPDRVIYLGTASKTLAPALRLGWLVLPGDLVGRVAAERMLADHGAPTLEQLTLARLIDGGAYDRHLRQARRRYRARRDALVAAVSRHLPDAEVTGLAAGLHAVVRLRREFDAATMMLTARRQSVGVYPLGYLYMKPRPGDDGLVLGYANLTESGIEEGIRRLALALAQCAGAQAAVSAERAALPGRGFANDGGAIAR
ncbi:MAG: GntR family transcriptional regulator / MocR family aminotransferase [Solirubrobacteraceae bacterium]|jgi:GntR family transcriptional regulator/MocR family aminotransferase|nr:GntR family transcriptional regulator / MocR family aminotransferase [Solirubrobacteraceae bacterium]